MGALIHVSHGLEKLPGRQGRAARRQHDGSAYLVPGKAGGTPRSPRGANRAPGLQGWKG